MAANVRAGAEYRARDSSPISMLTGLVQQGTEGLFSTQRILLDLFIRQNSMTFNAVRSALKPRDTEGARNTVSELAGDAIVNFVAAQRVLLNLAQTENAIMMTGVRERIGGFAPALAATDLLRKTVDTVVDMQQHFLTLAGKQAEAWVDSTKTGEPYAGKDLNEIARDAVDTFVRAQKKFLDVVVEEVSVATGGVAETMEATAEKTEVADLARQASEAFVDAQKKLMDVAGQQVDLTIRAAQRTAEMMTPIPRFDIGRLTRETVESFVVAQKALLDVMVKPARRATEVHVEPPTVTVATPRRRAGRRPRKHT